MGTARTQLKQLLGEIPAALVELAQQGASLASKEQSQAAAGGLAADLRRMAAVTSLLGFQDLSARLSGLSARLQALATAEPPPVAAWSDLAASLAALSAVDAEQLADSGPLRRLAAMLAEPAATRPMVYVVGKDEQARGRYQRMLKEADYNVQSFDIRDQLPLVADHLAATRPDAVLVLGAAGADRENPTAALKALRSAGGPATPMLLISDMDELAERLAALRAGASRYLLEPVAAEQLVSALNETQGCFHDTPYRVLLVDEDPLSLTALELILRAGRMDTRALPSPADILHQVDAYAPDVVLLQERLSLASGVELAQILKERDPLLPLLLLSDSPDIGERLLAAKLPGADFLNTPAPGAQLVAKTQDRALRYREKRTTRERLQRTLQEREQEHLALNQHAIVSVADRAGNIAYVNDKFCVVSGYSREELLGRNHRIVKSGRHSEGFYQDLWRTIRNGDVWQGEICNRRKDGSEYWVESTIFPHLDADGRPYRYTSIRTDVTRVKQAELELRRTHDLLEQVNDAALIGTWEYWPASDRLHWSRTTRRIHEVDDDYSCNVATAIGFYASEQDREALHRLFDEACVQGTPFDDQFQLRTAKGNLRHVRVVGLAELVRGKPLRVYGLFQDITKQTLLEQEHSRLSRIARETSNAVILTDAAGRINWVNDGFERITGYGKTEVIGRKPGDLLQGPESDPATVQAMRDAVARREPFKVDIVNHAKDGHPYWIRIECSPLRGPDGELEGFMAIESDITREKQDAERIRDSERHLREAQALAHIGSWQADLRSGALCWSDEVFRIFGHEPGGCTPSVAAFHDAIHPDDLATVRASEERAAQTGKHDVVHRIVRPDGGIRYVHELAQAQVDESGNVVTMTGTVQDVTEQIEAEQLLIAARDQAERASRAKSEFLASMSHELRTPMNAILGFGQILEYDEQLDADQRENVAEILRAGRHLLELINEVLDLAKIESGRIDLSLEPVELCPLVQESLALMAPLAEERGIRLSHQGIEGVRVRADRTRLRQALLNLLSNAIKYNRDQGRVAISVQRKEDNRLQLRVSDTGPGIPAEQLSALFEPFNRLGAETGSIEGTGIGLTLTRQLAEMMGGAVSVDSRIGVGSTFTLELPLEQDSPFLAPTSASGHLAAPQHRGTISSDQERKVLYIEDNPSNVKLVARLLGQREHVQLVTAHAPAMGIDLARSHRPDLILLDINLPGMDGYQVLQQLKADQRLATIPVVAISANAMERDRQRGLAAGFVTYLTKPLDVADFNAMLDRVLELPPSPC